MGTELEKALIKAAETLRTLSAQVNSLKAKVADYEKMEEAEKVANSMVEKGLLPQDRARDMAKTWITSKEDIKTIEKAAEMAENLPKSVWSGLGSSNSGDPDSMFESLIMGQR